MQTTVTNELATLRTIWRKWRAVVEQFSNQRSSRHHVDATAYQSLHSGVIDACRQAELSERETDCRTQIHDAEELSLPWMTLESLKRADKDILLNLATRCRMTERGCWEVERDRGADRSPRSSCSPACWVSYSACFP